MNEDLVTWLRAQLDDDERTARDAPGPKWQATVECEGEPGRWRGIRADLVTLADDEVTPDDPPEIFRAGRIVDRLGSPANAVQHAVRWDPARVLALTTALRAILDDFSHEAQETRAVRILAHALYGGRHGYSNEWRP